MEPRYRDIYVIYPMIKVIEMYIAFEPFCEYSSKTTLKYQICPVRNILASKTQLRQLRRNWEIFRDWEILTQNLRTKSPRILYFYINC